MEAAPYLRSSESPSAPVLRLTLSCEKTMPAAGSNPLTIRILYDAALGSRPIIFHTWRLTKSEIGYRMYHRHRSDEWKAYEDDYEGFYLVDNPDLVVHVAQHEDFVSLQPGEAWTTTQKMQGQGNGRLPYMEAGDEIRYLFAGAKVDWWDWGSKAEHADTVVTLPCFINGPVLDPKDNGGRPALIVSGSNTVEFSIE